VNADEASVLRYQKLQREKKRESADKLAIPCFMGLANETGFPHTGTIDFVDIAINPTTGTRRARGVFDNADGLLLPGYFARFRVAGQTLPGAMLVIDDAVGTDQDRKYVWLVHPDKTIERRPVTVGPLLEEMRVITGGISSDDLVIVNGLTSLQMVRPGGTVDATTTPMPEHRLAAARAAAAAAASAPATKPAETQANPPASRPAVGG
jgi:multidrug efflux system membrane fusion protein